MRKSFLVAALFCLCVSCSVKENRVGCPVFVRLIIDPFIQRGIDEGGICVLTPQAVDDQRAVFSSLNEEDLTFSLNRLLSGVCVYSSLTNNSISGRVMSVRSGLSADPLYAFGCQFSANSDDYCIVAQPQKQFCRVRILAPKDDTTFSSKRWVFGICAPCSSMDIFSLEPLTGQPYYASQTEPSSGHWELILPRQKSSEGISLSIDQIEDGLLRRIGIIDLGPVFSEYGYNWSETDLEDLVIELDMASVDITISVVNWVQDITYDIDI